MRLDRLGVIQWNVDNLVWEDVFKSFYCGPLPWLNHWFEIMPCSLHYQLHLQARACNGGNKGRQCKKGVSQSFPSFPPKLKVNKYDTLKVFLNKTIAFMLYK